MRLRALLACAAALAAGCRKRKQEDVGSTEPPRFVYMWPDARVDAAWQSEARCRAAVERIFAVAPLVRRSAERLAPKLVEACQRDVWSDALIACLSGARDARAVEGCKLTADQEQRLRTHIDPWTFGDDLDGVLIVDALSGGAAPGLLSPSDLELRLQRYARLLAIDVSLFQVLEAYPGSPKGTTFQSADYQWRRHEWISLSDVQKEVEEIAAAAAAAPSIPADAAVQAYGKWAAEWVPRLIALAEYYDGQRFVEDEFERGRKEAEAVRRTAAELGKLRAVMRPAVFGAWRELVAGYGATPRGAATTAWMACMEVADRVMERAAPPAVSRSVSECRRSIATVTEMAPTSGFDHEVRAAAVELGDWVAQGHPARRTGIGDTLGKLTSRYLALFPRLSATPPERPAR